MIPPDFIPLAALSAFAIVTLLGAPLGSYLGYLFICRHSNR